MISSGYLDRGSHKSDFFSEMTYHHTYQIGMQGKKGKNN